MMIRENELGNKIALLGGARTGKDTAAQYLGAVYGHERFAFGDGVREVFHEILFPHIPTEPKPRDGYITLAQACRSIYPNVWVDKAKQVYHSMRAVGIESFVVTDVRQQNEIDWLREEGFVFLRITSNRQMERVEALGESLDVNNYLDNALNGFECLEIDNSGSLEELYAQLDEIMGYFGKGLEEED